MHVIDYIAIHSNDNDDITDNQKVGDAFRYSSSRVSSMVLYQ
jgi:hypothetical protein